MSKNGAENLKMAEQTSPQHIKVGCELSTSAGNDFLKPTRHNTWYVANSTVMLKW
jgi:hypothetical protein